MPNLVHFFEAGGWVMYPLLFISLLAIWVIVERLIAYRTLAEPARGLLSEVVDLCSTDQFDKALAACGSHQGPVAASLSTILRNRHQDVEDVERNVQEVAEGYFIKMERLLPILDTSTTISPLLGLLGTLFGMISTFRAIAASKSQGANDAILAGVGEALYATATGLTIAVVCFITYNYFSARQKLVTEETEQAATKLINVLRARGSLGSTREREKVGV